MDIKQKAFICNNNPGNFGIQTTQLPVAKPDCILRQKKTLTMLPDPTQENLLLACKMCMRRTTVLLRWTPESPEILQTNLQTLMLTFLSQHSRTQRQALSCLTTHMSIW